MGNTLKRYNSIRRADDLNDQQGTPAIANPLAAETQEQLQTIFLSRLRQIIFGESAPEHWYDDLFSSGILSLKELTARGPGGGGETVLLRVGVPLVGSIDGVNRIFRTTDRFVHGGSDGKTIELWHNGRLLTQSSVPDPRFGDYTVGESGGVGTGFDTINLLRFSPVNSSSLLATYQRAV